MCGVKRLFRLLCRRRLDAVALGVVLLLALNGSILAVSLVFAVPVHARLDREGKRADLLALLYRYNLPHLVASTVSTLLLVRLLVQVLRV